MHNEKEALLLLISTPLYALVICVEMIASRIHHRHYYSAKGAMMNVLLSSLNFGLDVLMLGFCISILGFFQKSAFFTFLDKGIIYWCSLFILLDYLFYILHYIDHHCRLFWAVHVTHHNSEEFNLTVGFRSSVFQPLYRFIYFIPLAKLGFEPMDIMFTYSASQIYGILIHTQFIDKLGPLEWFMATPSHHRVHHGSNARYLDRNMGMLLILWDKLHGTFESESEMVRYGLTKNINTFNPFKTVFHEWIGIFNDVKSAPTLKDKFMYIFGPPGWHHDSMS